MTSPDNEILRETPNPPHRPSSQAAYSDLFHRLLDAVVILDTVTFQLIDANAAAERLFGLPHEELCGDRTLSHWVASAGREEFERELRVSARRYYPRQFNARFNFPVEGTDHEIYGEVVVCLLQLQGGKTAIQAVLRDVTAQYENSRKVSDAMRQLEEINRQLEVLSITDGMTGLANFRRFRERLQIEHDRAARYDNPYSLVFIDVDHFKMFNDRNGHPAGDEALRWVARCLRVACRSTDLPARYGGEEFAVLCPETRIDGAKNLAERVRAAVEEIVLEGVATQPLGKLSVSIGIAEYPQNATSPDELIRAADQALYEAKTQGRNRVIASAGLLRS